MMGSAISRVLYDNVIGLESLGLLICSGDETVLYINQKALELAGSGKEDAEPKSFIGKGIHEVAGHYKSVFDLVRVKGKLWNHEAFIEHVQKWLLFNGSTADEGDEKNAYILITAGDISHYKNIELELRRSQATLNSIINTIPDIVYRVNAEGTITFISDVVREYGYTTDELVGTNILNIVHSDDREKAIRRLSERRTGDRRTRSFHLRLLKKNREPVSVKCEETVFTTPELFEISSEGIYHMDENRNKVYIGTQGIARDISVRNNGESPFHRTEEGMNDILNALDDGFYEVDLKGIFTFVNDALCNCMGYDREEFLGRDFHMLFSEDIAKEIFNIFRNVAETKNTHDLIDVETLRKDGKRRLVEVSVSLICDNERKPRGFRGIVRDVTEKKKMEEEISMARKVEAIGILAGGIAHDYNNALTAILGNISLAKMVVGKNNKELGDILNDAEKASMRILELTKRLGIYAKGGKPIIISTPPAMLKQVVEERTDAVLNGFRGSYKMIVDEGLPNAQVDAIQFSHVIEHIVTNAKESMPEGGTITIDIKNVAVQQEKTQHDLSLHAGNYVVVMIHDEGIGIKKEIMGNIFDPYFTTKESASGMGLAISYAIIKRHHGYIDVESEEGKGTLVSIYLPIR